jgi:hypothetical protein
MLILQFTVRLAALPDGIVVAVACLLLLLLLHLCTRHDGEQHQEERLVCVPAAGPAGGAAVAAVVHEQRHTEHLDGAAQAGAVSAQLLLPCSKGACGSLVPS